MTNPIPHSYPEALLQQAMTVLAQRGKQRDQKDGERSMARAVAIYNAATGMGVMDETRGWLFMVCLKIARSQIGAGAGAFNFDDYVDMAGYAALLAESAHKDWEARKAKSEKQMELFAEGPGAVDPDTNEYYARP